jgi:SAM-dependent methyltransferase
VIDLLLQWLARRRPPDREDVRPPAVDGVPLPPGVMRMKVAGSASAHRYLDSGEQDAARIQRLLARHGVELSGALLDFHCGSGRLLRQWRQPGLELHGCDSDAEQARWSRQHLPFTRVAVNGSAPPVPYRDARFDFVCAIDAFAHWDGPSQLPWAREFRRILRPGGHLIFNTFGNTTGGAMLQGADRRQFDAGRLVVRGARSSGAQLCRAFHPEPYVREHLARGFEVLGAEPTADGQQLWLLRRQ